jgi:hypothetical protein
MRRVVLIQNGTQLNMSITLGGGDPRMTQKLLDGLQIPSRGQKMRGEAVPQRVRGG